MDVNPVSFTLQDIQGFFDENFLVKVSDFKVLCYMIQTFREIFKFVSRDDKFTIKMVKYEKLEFLSEIKLGAVTDIIKIKNIWMNELNFEQKY